MAFSLSRQHADISENVANALPIKNNSISPSTDSNNDDRQERLQKYALFDRSLRMHDTSSQSDSSSSIDQFFSENIENIDTLDDPNSFDSLQDEFINVVQNMEALRPILANKDNKMQFDLLSRRKDILAHRLSASWIYWTVW